MKTTIANTEKSMKQIRIERTETVRKAIQKLGKTTNKELVQKTGLNIFIVNGVLSGLIYTDGLQVQRDFSNKVSLVSAR